MAVHCLIAHFHVQLANNFHGFMILEQGQEQALQGLMQLLQEEEALLWLKQKHLHRLQSSLLLPLCFLHPLSSLPLVVHQGILLAGWQPCLTAFSSLPPGALSSFSRSSVPGTS